MKQFRIHKDDKVMVIAGKDEGKIGKVLKVLRKSAQVRPHSGGEGERCEAQRASQSLQARSRRHR